MRIFHLFISSGILIGLVLLIRKVFHNKLAPGVIYGLWLIPFIRLLIPFGLWEMPVFGTAADVLNAPYYLAEGLIDNIEFENEDGENQREEDTDRIELYSHSKIDMPNKEIDNPIKEAASNNIYEKNDENIRTEWEKNSYLRCPGILLHIIWLMGILFVVCYTLIRNLQFKNNLQSKRTIISSEGIVIRVSDSIQIPCLVGFIDPVIIMPEKIHQDPELYEYALRHELAHYKQKDHLWTAARILMCIVYWWNPFVWIGAKYVGEDAELSCDARVIKNQLPDEKRKYGYALLKMLENTQGINCDMCIAASLNGNKNTMKQRIYEIANGTNTRKSILIPMLVVMSAIFILGCGFPTQKSWIKTEDWKNGETDDAMYMEAEYSYALKEDINSMLLYYEIYEYGELIERSILSYGEIDKQKDTIKLRRESAKFENKHTLIMEANGIGVEMESPSAKYAVNERYAGDALWTSDKKLEVTAGTDLIVLTDYRARGEEALVTYDYERLSTYTEKEMNLVLEDSYIACFVRLVFSNEQPEEIYETFLKREYKQKEELQTENQKLQEEVSEKTVASSWIWPTESTKISTEFGQLPNGRFSDHINIAGEKGDDIYAVIDGTVSDMGFDSEIGNYIILTGEGELQIQYGHLDQILVEKNQKLTQGEIIATMGQTGMATGPNLAFMVHMNGEVIDPMKYE